MLKFSAEGGIPVYSRHICDSDLKVSTFVSEDQKNKIVQSWLKVLVFA